MSWRLGTGGSACAGGPLGENPRNLIDVRMLFHAECGDEAGTEQKTLLIIKLTNEIMGKYTNNYSIDQMIH